MLISNRPNLKESSIKTYVSNIYNLNKKIFDTEDINNLKNQSIVLQYLLTIDYKSRKTNDGNFEFILPNDSNEYSRQMDLDAETYRNEESKQIKNEKQTENWLNQNELQEIIDEYKLKAKNLLKKSSIGMDDLQEIQQYIILCLTSGIYISPRRSLDWCEMKWKDPTENDNEVVITNSRKKSANKFIFNRYKTDKYFGVQEIEYLYIIIKTFNKWIELLNIFFNNDIFDCINLLNILKYN